ncbi:unnamed protein product [Sphagnum troendelagicum]
MTAELLPRAAAELNIINGSRNDIEMLSTSSSSSGGPDSSNHKKGRRSGEEPPAAAAAAAAGGGGSTQKRQQQQQQQQQQTPAEHEENGQKQKRKSSSARLSIETANMLLYKVRRSLKGSCHSMQEEEEEEIVQRPLQAPVIEWPTHVQHIAHVTFDRYNGFLGLPEEFKIEVPLRPPSASQTIFGVSIESMQCAFDSRGNSVPVILLLMQQQLYQRGGLKVEGIFRINAENGHAKHVWDQLNKGIVPVDIDVHCLAGLIKAWFRELPEGLLDVFTPPQVMECKSEEESVALVRLLPTTQASLLDWAVNLMADVVQQEAINKMNSHNIAMVFAPNMTQILDPLTALLHVVQVMNLLKMLIIRKLRDRHEEVALLIKEDHQHRPATALAETTNSQADEHDEPDSIDSSGSVLHSGHQKQYRCTTSAPPQCTADTKVVYEENSHHHHHHITIPPNLKCSTTAKPNSGKLVNTISTGVWSFCCWVSRHLFLACKALL